MQAKIYSKRGLDAHPAYLLCRISRVCTARRRSWRSQRNYRIPVDRSQQLIKQYMKALESASLTVGTYSDGNLLVVYEMSRQVLPTAPSPTTTHFMVCMIYIGCEQNKKYDESDNVIRWTYLGELSMAVDMIKVKDKQMIETVVNSAQPVSQYAPTSHGRNKNDFRLELVETSRRQ